jgi:hypothetical protein
MVSVEFPEGKQQRPRMICLVYEHTVATINLIRQDMYSTSILKN